VSNVLQYLHGLRVDMSMLAVAGVHRVKSNHERDAQGAPREVVHAPLDICFSYWSFAEEKVLAYTRRFPGCSSVQVLTWLRAADEATCTRVMELVRLTPKSTVGEAFSQAQADTASEWTLPQLVSAKSTGGERTRGNKGDNKGDAKGEAKPENKPPWVSSRMENSKFPHKKKR
jgi:hypothetical protein